MTDQKVVFTGWVAENASWRALVREKQGFLNREFFEFFGMGINAPKMNAKPSEGEAIR